MHAKLWLQLDDILLVGEAFNRSKKVAKGKAALYLLKELEDRGISRKRTKQDHAGSSGTTDDDLLEPKMCKKQRIAEIPSPTNDSSRTAYGTEIPSPANASSRTAYGFSSDALGMQHSVQNLVLKPYCKDKHK